METRPAEASRLSNEPIRQRMAIAKRWVDRLTSDARAVDAELARWSQYLALLEAVDRAEHQLDVAVVYSGVPVTARSAQKWSVTEHVVHFAFYQPDCRVSIKAAAEFTVDQGLAGERARASISGILAHRTDLFRRHDRGNYSLTAKGMQLAKKLADDVRSHVSIPVEKGDASTGRWLPLLPLGEAEAPFAVAGSRVN